MAEKRNNPVKNQMTRRDSLSSMSEFGKIVPPAAQDSVRMKSIKIGTKNPFQHVLGAMRNATKGKK